MRISIHRQVANVASSRHLDELLDAALADSFPASDPVAIGIAQPAQHAAGDHERDTKAAPVGGLGPRAAPVPRSSL